MPAFKNIGEMSVAKNQHLECCGSVVNITIEKLLNNRLDHLEKCVFIFNIDSGILIPLLIFWKLQLIEFSALFKWLVPLELYLIYRKPLKGFALCSPSQSKVYGISSQIFRLVSLFVSVWLLSVGPNRESLLLMLGFFKFPFLVPLSLPVLY